MSCQYAETGCTYPEQIASLRAEVARLNALLQTRASELLEMQKAAKLQQARAERAEAEVAKAKKWETLTYAFAQVCHTMDAHHPGDWPRSVERQWQKATEMEQALTPPAEEKRT